MQQRVGLVRALAINPSILLMDEPFAALDAQTREILQEELLQLMETPDERKTMVFITHSIDEAILLGDRVAVMTARPGPHQGNDRHAVRPAARRRGGARRSAFRRVARAYLAPAAQRAGATDEAAQGGGMSTVVDTAAGAVDTSEERARAQKAAAERRRKRQLQVVAIRLVSVATFLAIWEVFGGQVNPALFTTPSKVAVAAVHMVRSGELWAYLAPSLLVLAIGLSLAAVTGIAIGLLLARFWVVDVAFGVYITFLYSTPGRAGAADRAVGRLRDHRQGHHPVPVRVLPDGDQHLPGRQERRPEAARGRPRVSLLRRPALAQHRAAGARCPSSSPACASPSAAA